MMEEGLCDVCENIDGIDCKFCCVRVCSECALKEKHNEGDFNCNLCKRFICKSYEHRDGTCWFCLMNTGLSKLKPRLATAFLGLMDQALDQGLDHKTVQHRLVGIALEDSRNKNHLKKNI